MASQEQSGHDGFIREKIWVKRPVGTHLSDSQKQPGEHSSLIRDDATNELGQVTLEDIDENENDSSASWQPWAGSVSLLEFDGVGGLPRLAGVSSPGGPVFLDDPANTAVWASALVRLQGLALSSCEQDSLLNGLVGK